MLSKTGCVAACMLVLIVPGLVLAQETVSVELGEVDSGRLEQTIVLPGELRPFQEVDLRANVTGFVERMLVDRGSRVRKGDLIAERAARLGPLIGLLLKPLNLLRKANLYLNLRDEMVVVAKPTN